MIEYLPSHADVLAVKVTGKLLHDQLEAVADKVEAALEANGKTHIFVEVAEFHGFDLSALPDYLPRAAKMLGKLDRFGRIAAFVGRQSLSRKARRMVSRCSVCFRPTRFRWE